jgi:hypothetical protein
MLLGDQVPISDPVLSGPDGRFTLDAAEFVAGGGIRPEQRFEAFYVGDQGHHIRRVYRGPTLSLTLGARRADAGAMPGASLQVAITATDQPVAHLDVVADDLGRSAWLWPRPAATGDALALETGGTLIATVVPSLTAQLDAATGILAGTAPAGHLVDATVSLGAAGDLPERRYAFSTDDGSWRMNLADTGRGTSLDPAQIRSVTVSLRDPGVTTNRIVPGPLADSGRVWLPWTGSSVP